MSVLKTAATEGAMYKVEIEVAALCCDATLPVGAIVKVLQVVSPNRIRVSVNVGRATYAHKVRWSTFRSSAVEIPT